MDIIERVGYTFSLDVLIAKVRQLAAEHPQTVYKQDIPTAHGPTCSYLRGVSHNDIEVPGCLFGQILPSDWVQEDHTGGIKDILRNLDSDGNPVDHGFTVLDGITENHDQKLRWLQKVQQCQDRGDPWALAVAIADNEFPL